MKPAILDTDILLDILNGRPARVQEYARRYRETYLRYTITAVTIAELARGLGRQGNGHEWLDQILAQVEVLPLDSTAARLAGQIYGELERIGQGIGWADCLIAGIALSLLPYSAAGYDPNSTTSRAKRSNSSSDALTVSSCRCPCRSI